MTSVLVDGQRSKGVELGVSGRISEAWSIQGGYAYQDGYLTDAMGPLLAGLKLAQLPKNVVSLWNRYDFTAAWGVGLGVIYQTEMFASSDNLVTLPGFTRVDAGIYYTPNERLRMQLNVENLLDERYYPNANSNNNITPGSPLAIRAGVTMQFSAIRSRSRFIIPTIQNRTWGVSQCTRKPWLSSPARCRLGRLRPDRRPLRRKPPFLNP